MTDIRVADAQRGNLTDRYAPSWLKPYARLARWDRPIGWWLLLIPCWWSAALASASAGAALPNIVHLVLFFVGAVAMRGAGCTYNDIVDRDLDAGVARTRSRPIPSGAVSVRAAKIFLLVQALVGLAVLLSFNGFTILLGIASLAVVAAYPFMKRITDWPQSVLGLAFSWGALMGWAAWHGSLALPPILLFAGGVAWTIGYDTIYALQDKEDDAIMGVRSTARLFGDRTPLFVGLFYAVATLFFAVSFWTAGVGWIAWAGLALGTLQLMVQVRSIDVNNGDKALHLFKSNRSFGLVVFLGLVLDGFF
ncbi:4-hydroxybenzoate octaprenyltransferase [Kaistia algarum]|uniref:4-hydroxybenzoate octaprenyltransferase n=1 Tax=Kaistia algarum TaxID=2083279 RepID=UPI000CE81B7B|nr:4-hydroxybenzoate octaprenyltransferase [Kaistia algarum]MCX5512430.1 4-hydroxybenzoate octaprenyltransferase [Kaistia algarum]PPE80510.1 4-hydroxybenzoate octaprenyltransferase [Kaistia algarum]